MSDAMAAATAAPRAHTQQTRAGGGRGTAAWRACARPQRRPRRKQSRRRRPAKMHWELLELIRSRLLARCWSTHLRTTAIFSGPGARRGGPRAVAGPPGGAGPKRCPPDGPPGPAPAPLREGPPLPLWLGLNDTWGPSMGRAPAAAAPPLSLGTSRALLSLLSLLRCAHMRRARHGTFVCSRQCAALCRQLLTP
jgi:hypothetical protein